jgi:TldD protein
MDALEIASSTAAAASLTRRTFLRGATALGVGATLARGTLGAFEPALAAVTQAALPAVSSFLTRNQVAELLTIARAKGAHFAEVYGEYTINTTFVVDENALKRVQYGILSGVGVRVLHGEVCGYAYADEYGMPALRDAAHVAAAVAAGAPAGPPTPFRVSTAKAPFTLTRPAPLFASEKQKIDLALRVDKAARATDPRVKQAQVQLADSAKAILIADSEGLWVEDRQFISRLAAQVTAVDGANRQNGATAAGGAVEADYFDRVVTPEQIGAKAATAAVTLLSAVDAKAGSYPVVIAPGWGGVLVHECFGHSLEGDGIRKKTSIREHQLGQKVCADIVDIYDDATVPNSRGSFKVDDEGTPAQKTHAVEKGILKGYLWDRLNAELTGHRSTGNGRRASYRDFPIPRMTNTYIAAGTSKAADLIASVKSGIYCKNMLGGSVNPADGIFSFACTESYLIENGKITSPVKDVTLTGNAAASMLNVQGLGDDLVVDECTGSCGKDGQFKPVGVGQPTVLFSEMTVGGTHA